ncbi:MAG: hemolysin III family protein [Phycisphaera sp.]|nr:hemolysin III family protein [Phycisphaera sp.]
MDLLKSIPVSIRSILNAVVRLPAYGASGHGEALRRPLSSLRVTDHEQERMNAVTHGLGLAFGIAGAAIVVVLAARHGGTWQVWGCAIYAATLVAVFATSTLSHMLHRPRLRHMMRTADQAMIFLFIAGSYTPVAMAWLRGGPWWVLHALVWGVALAGFISKALFAHNVRLGRVSTALYLLLGWMPVMAAWPLLTTLPTGLVVWLVVGGLFYTVGTVFFRYDHQVRYFHAAWHVLVLAGSTCHYLGIVLYCTTPASRAANL